MRLLHFYSINAPWHGRMKCSILQDSRKTSLPTPQPSGSFIGEVTPEAAEKTGLMPGTPIFQGGHDYLVGALAAGAISSGMFLDVTGTWEMVITPTTDPQWGSEIRQVRLNGRSTFSSWHVLHLGWGNCCKYAGMVQRSDRIQSPKPRPGWSRKCVVAPDG